MKEELKQKNASEKDRNSKQRNVSEKDRNSRQRGSIDSALGFQRYGLVPKEDTIYSPPSFFHEDEVPADCQDYLVGLSRCGTLSGACKLAGIAVNRVYTWRKQFGYDFKDEEEIAKDCLIDLIEEELFAAGLGFAEDIKGRSRVNAMETALKANRDKYNPKQKHDIEGEVTMSWLDILHEADKEQKEKAEKE